MSKPAFTIEQVRSFLAVADHVHVSRAAASLSLTQGAVTQQIHNFERALGLRLLEREVRFSARQPGKTRPETVAGRLRFHRQTTLCPCTATLCHPLTRFDAPGTAHARRHERL